MCLLRFAGPFLAVSTDRGVGLKNASDVTKVPQQVPLSVEQMLQTIALIPVIPRRNIMYLVGCLNQVLDNPLVFVPD